jgi:hypothetical protein
MAIWAMTWETRCEIGACEVTQGQDAEAADWVAWAGLRAAAPAGTAMSAAAAAAASTAVTRPALEKGLCRARKE